MGDRLNTEAAANGSELHASDRLVESSERAAPASAPSTGSLANRVIRGERET